MWGRQWGVRRGESGTHWGHGLVEAGFPGKSFLNITTVLALEPSMGTAESSRLTSAPLLPFLSAAQAEGVKLGDRQALGGWSVAGAGCLVRHLPGGFLGPTVCFHFCDICSLGSGLMKLGEVEPGPIACKEPKDHQSSLRTPPRKSACGIPPELLFFLSEGLLADA